MMASMRDGSGEHYFALFSRHGLIIKGFEQYSDNGKTYLKSEKLDKSIVSNVPEEFNDFLKEPAFEIERTSFCVWNLYTQDLWKSGKVLTKEELYLLKVLEDGAEGYKRWAQEYYEKIIPITSVRRIFDAEPLNEDIIRSLNDEITIDDILVDADEIGYLVKTS